jgi:hypothetical protein
MISQPGESKTESLFWSALSHFIKGKPKSIEPQSKINRYYREIEQSFDSKEITHPAIYLCNLLRNFVEAHDQENHDDHRKYLKLAESFLKLKSPNLLDFYNSLHAYLQGFLSNVLIENPFFARVLVFSDYFEPYLIVNGIELPAILRQTLTDHRFNTLLKHINQSPIQKTGIAAIQMLPNFFPVSDLGDKRLDQMIETLLSLLTNKDPTVIENKGTIVESLGELANIPSVKRQQRQKIINVILFQIKDSSYESAKLGKLLSTILGFSAEQTKTSLSTLLAQLDTSAGYYTLLALEELITGLVMNDEWYGMIIRALVKIDLFLKIENILQPLKNSPQIQISSDDGKTIVQSLLRQSHSEDPYNKHLADKALAYLLKRNPGFFDKDQYEKFILDIVESINRYRRDQDRFKSYESLFSQSIASPLRTDQFLEKLFDSLFNMLSVCQPKKCEGTIQLFAKLPPADNKKLDRAFDVLKGNLNRLTIFQLPLLGWISAEQWIELFDSLGEKSNNDADHMFMKMKTFIEWNAAQRMNDKQLASMIDFLNDNENHTDPNIQEDVIRISTELMRSKRVPDKQKQQLLELALKKLNSPHHTVQRTSIDMFKKFASYPIICSQCPELVPALIEKIDQPTINISYPIIIEVLSDLIINPNIRSTERQIIREVFFEELNKPDLLHKFTYLIWALWDNPDKHLEDDDRIIQAFTKNFIYREEFFSISKQTKREDKIQEIKDALLKNKSTSGAQKKLLTQTQAEAEKETILATLKTLSPEKPTTVLLKMLLEWVPIEFYQEAIQFLFKQLDKINFLLPEYAPKFGNNSPKLLNKFHFPLQTHIANALQDQPEKLNVLISSLCEATIAPGSPSVQLQSMSIFRKELQTAVDKKITECLPMLTKEQRDNVIGYYR